MKTHYDSREKKARVDLTEAIKLNKLYEVTQKFHCANSNLLDVIFNYNYIYSQMAGSKFNSDYANKITPKDIFLSNAFHTNNFEFWDNMNTRQSFEFFSYCLKSSPSVWKAWLQVLALILNRVFWSKRMLRTFENMVCKNQRTYIGI